MPLYEFKDKVTGEVTEKIFSFASREEYLKENTNLEIVIGLPGLISMHGSALNKTSGDWKDLLKRVKKGSGKGNTVNT